MKNKLLICLLVLSAYTLACSSSSVNVAVNTANANATNASTQSGPPADAGAVDQAKAAETVVADLYKAHDGKKSPFFQTKDRALVDKFFTKTLADLIWKDATESKGEVGAIDDDPLYNAQDMEIKNFAIGKGEVKGDTATVPVTFTNFGQKQTITLSLKQVNAAWKIDNISYGDGDSLMKWLRDTYPDKGKQASADGVFEGKYQVGDTSCTVTPSKMAYDVRWAKGSGVETFFYKDGNTFASAVGEEANEFVFNDENYNSGTFHRADGKTFPVKRAK